MGDAVPAFRLDHDKIAALNARIADDLYVQGWSVCTDYVPEDLRAALLADLAAQEEAGRLTLAAVGRDTTQTVETTIRNDRTLWLAGRDAAPAAYLDLMGRLRLDLNRRLILGLFEYEAHYARYDAGGFYRKHVDALHGERNRVVSTVTYLTPDWAESDGGHLVLYDAVDQDRAIARVLPAAGTLAVFLSEEIPHEVLPPARPRNSIAGWFRCNPSGEDRVDPLR
ncbi:2OG-Fe(II) oxygenase [Micavibrio aeruginosavorus]|uniref:SM-20-related protein n=1 Tax=Micavibrio aeruginosavorus EPB TaxID=349215 RepID=M4VIA6_9BACT|nr:2OG-Fe(II) oxygenase [Micavibrio aeruginosavorus]AGH99112.1 SM-20-related protein [Micavibrio aeruginosavorus EPB]